MASCGKRVARPREAGLALPLAKKAKPSSVGVVRIEKKTACSTAATRKPAATLPTEAGEAVTDNNDVGGNHNKYCHFCQHVKVRASSMLACENQECSRRFCEHCLLTHLGEDVDPMSSDAWQMVDGKACWNCPICRKKCCCSVTECSATHRHCKAYRYRRRRAELALKRVAVMTDKRAGAGAGAGKKVAPKKTLCAAVARPMLALVVDDTFDELSAVHTPPASVGEWTSMHGKGKPWTMQHIAVDLADCEDRASSIDSVVGTPRGEAEGEQQRMHEELLRGAWSHALGADDHDSASPSMPLLLYSHSDLHGDDDEMSARHDGSHSSSSVHSLSTEVHGEDSDEIMASVLGHMSDTTDLDDISSEVSDLGWSAQVDLDLPPLDALLDEAEMRSRQLPDANEVDEVEWLRRTYETVYNPAARQRALDQLVSSANVKDKQSVEKTCFFASKSTSTPSVAHHFV